MVFSFCMSHCSEAVLQGDSGSCSPVRGFSPLALSTLTPPEIYTLKGVCRISAGHLVVVDAIEKANKSVMFLVGIVEEVQGPRAEKGPKVSPVSGFEQG